MRLRIDCAYDGADFSGWATQPTLRTVQATLEDALATALRIPRCGSPSRVAPTPACTPAARSRTSTSTPTR